MVLMDDVVKGSASASAIGITWLVMTVAVAVLLALAYRSFQREDVLFRTYRTRRRASALGLAARRRLAVRRVDRAPAAARP